MRPVWALVAEIHRDDAERAARVGELLGRLAAQCAETPRAETDPCGDPDPHRPHQIIVGMGDIQQRPGRALHVFEDGQR